MAVVLALSTLAEQLGWTGYLQPRLEHRVGKLGSGLLIGVLWGLWHVVPTA